MSDSAYRCVACHRGKLIAGSGLMRCEKCNASFEVRHGVVKAVTTEPAKAYLDALSYARKCQEQAGRAWDAFVIDENPAHQSRQNLQEHLLNFESVMASLKGDLPETGTMLQLGCRDTVFYANWFLAKGYTVYAVDYYIHLNENYRPLLENSDEPRLAACDYDNLPFEDNTFDCIIASHSLMHSANLTATLAEIKRVLKPGGRLIILNEQLRGLLTPTLKYQNIGKLMRREKRYFVGDYKRALLANGYDQMALYFPEYQHQLLMFNRVTPFTFKILSLILRPFWRNDGARRCIRKNWIWAAYYIIGFPLQVVAVKPTEGTEPQATFTPPGDAPEGLANRLPQRGDVGERRQGNRSGEDRRKRDL